MAVDANLNGIGKVRAKLDEQRFNIEAYYAENAYPVEIPCYIPLTDDNNALFFVGWSVDASWDHVISVLIQVEGPDEPNIWRVLEAFSDLLERFMDVLRRVF